MNKEDRVAWWDLNDLKTIAMINDLAIQHKYLSYKFLCHHFFLGLDVRWRRLLSVGCRNCSGIFWTGKTFANTWRFVSFLASTFRLELVSCMKLGLWFMILISEPSKTSNFSVLLGLSLRGYHQAFGGKNSVVFPRSRFGRIFDRGASSRILRRWSSPLFIWFGKKISQHRYAFHVQLSSLIPDTSPVHLTNFASLCL